MHTDTILYADVILTLHLPLSYCYRVPKSLHDSIKVGQSVVVQFGKKKIYSALVVNLHHDTPKTSQIKYILDIVDIEPTITPKQIEFFKWIADYYIAYIGDVLTAALPAVFRLKSETIVEISPYFSGDLSALNTEEQNLVNQVIQKGKLKLEDYEGEQADTFLKLVSNLIKQDVLSTDEELYAKYTPKKELCIALSQEYENQDKQKQLFTELDSKKSLASQSKTLLTFFSLLQGRDMVRKSEIIDKGCSVSSLQTLLKKGVFEVREVEVSRLRQLTETKQIDSIILNDEQQNAYDSILSQWNNKPVSLLYGVTGSGKTEIYIKLIDKIIKEGGQVLYLIPEIAISFQLIERLEQYFGNKIAVYNSKFSTLERAEIYNRVKLAEDNDSRLQIVLGSRSSVFLPFKNLQLVIVDEEHDASFKQAEPVPHYNAKDSALYIAKMFNAKTILASATPSLESYYRAKQGDYQLLEIKHRYFNTLLPEILIADTKDAVSKGEMYGVMTKMLHDEIADTLKNNQQIIIFQNRRGYAPHITCNICGYTPKCPNCDVSLVLHKQTHTLNCHYCGHTTDVPAYCPDCHSHSIKTIGLGTERIEEELATYFPKASIMRMDLDSTRTKQAYDSIIKNFASKKIDILVGTQIVSKGLDFDNVGLVGVIDADTMLHFADFRAYERAFQTLCQVSGRAGRRTGRGKVIIQTYEPYNQIIRDVSEHNYESMFSHQIKERKALNFPPFCRMIKITLQHKDRYNLKNKAYEYASNLKTLFGTRMFGPQEPQIARVRNMYSQIIWLKIEKQLSYQISRTKLREFNEEFLSKADNKSLRISIDVDPI